ncbi:integral membrane protein GPR155-like [Actinia tenebrosa]|uniref:Integral membrane protein GPR155-like n=1 Tax=Actinia tenebrosa TaxID=6105 RepID=A0A6P8I5C2_ACTTE|nr:integral membrane protein GPR155-like [Actinia tenebrosa]
MEGNSTTSGGPTDINNLFPALVECFAIILLGYVSGRFGFISTAQGKGIGNFVSHFALPALLFKSMVELDFLKVNWKFLAAILIAKGIVFIIVVVLTLILGKPQKYGRAGIFAIFCTQSNDFALGFPLLKALYRDSMPDFLSYIYLLAPISVVLLNPIGFIFLEFNKHSDHLNLKKGHVAIATIKGVILNPIVFMTFIGIIANFILRQKVPVIINGFLDVLSSSFFASALFFLGLKMVGNMKKKMGYGLIVPLLLIFTKILFVPLLAREFIQILDVGGSNNTLTNEWSMFGFLYGTIPTAPTVIIFASRFGVAEDLIATGVVLGTFLSAPVLYTSARMIAIKYTPALRLHYHSIIGKTIYDACGVSIPFGLWVIAMLLLGRRWRLLPQKYTLHLVVSQVIFSSLTLLTDIDCTFKYWHLVLFASISVTGLLCRCWTAMLAFSLCLVRCKGGSIKTWQPWIYFFSFGLPVVFTGMKLCFVVLKQPAHDTQPYLAYVQNQRAVLVLEVIALALCIIIIIWSLIRLQRCDKFCKCPKSVRRLSSPHLTGLSNTDEECKARCNRCQEIEKEITQNDCGSSNDNCCTNVKTSNTVLDIESLDESTCLLSSGKRNTRYVDSDSVPSELNELETALSLQEYYEDGDKHQLVQHVILILILAFSFCVGLFMCVWYLTNESRKSGLFIAMRVLDMILLFGQGFITFACFGMDKQLIIVPFVKRFRKLFYGAEAVTLTPPDELSPEVVHLCEQFSKHHRQKCKRALVENKTYHFRTYHNVFCGDQLVSWLVDLGLAEDRVAATNYGNSLLQGRLIEHVTKEHFFYDLPYFYHFC